MVSGVSAHPGVEFHPEAARGGCSHVYVAKGDEKVHLFSERSAYEVEINEQNQYLDMNLQNGNKRRTFTIVAGTNTP